MGVEEFLPEKRHQILHLNQTSLGQLLSVEMVVVDTLVEGEVQADTVNKVAELPDMEVDLDWHTALDLVLADHMVADKDN